MKAELLIKAWKETREESKEASPEEREAILDLLAQMARDLVGPGTKLQKDTNTTLIIMSNLWLGIKIGQKLGEFEKGEGLPPTP